jgi:hypothetical protein
MAYQRERDRIADEQWQKEYDLSRSSLSKSRSSGGSSRRSSGGSSSKSYAVTNNTSSGNSNQLKMVQGPGQSTVKFKDRNGNTLILTDDNGNPIKPNNANNMSWSQKLFYNAIPKF